MISVWGMIIFLIIAALVVVATVIAAKNGADGLVIRGNIVVVFICLVGAILMLFHYLKDLHH